MNAIGFKTKTGYDGQQVDMYRNLIPFETKHYKANFKSSVVLGRGITKLEVKNLPKGITVISKQPKSNRI